MTHKVQNIRWKKKSWQSRLAQLSRCWSDADASCRISGHLLIPHACDAEHEVALKGNYCDRSLIRLWTVCHLCTCTHTHTRRQTCWGGCHKSFELISMLNSHCSGLSPLFCLLLKQKCLMLLSGAAYLHCVCILSKLWLRREYEWDFATLKCSSSVSVWSCFGVCVRMKERSRNVLPVCMSAAE